MNQVLLQVPVMYSLCFYILYTISKTLVTKIYSLCSVVPTYTHKHEYQGQGRSDELVRKSILGVFSSDELQMPN